MLRRCSLWLKRRLAWPLQGRTSSFIFVRQSANGCAAASLTIVANTLGVNVDLSEVERLCPPSARPSLPTWMRQS